MSKNNSTTFYLLILMAVVINNNCYPTKVLTDEVECLKEGECTGQQKFQLKCCAENDVCENDGKCVSKEIEFAITPATTVCPESQQCLGKCCATNEECDPKGSECILRAFNALDCPQSLQCNDKCCAENQICQNGNECIVGKDNGLECTLSQKCQGKCCGLQQTCSKDNECVDAAIESTTTSTQNFLDCSERNKCISIKTFDCQGTEKCGNKCCPVNETCNYDNVCDAFIELTTILDNCSEEQEKCLDICCLPHEVCNEKNECVRETQQDFSTSYDASNEITTDKSEIVNDFDTIIPIYDFDAIDKAINCSKDQYLCQQKCCNYEEICNQLGECEEKINEKDCDLDQSCLENVNINDTAYAVIGLGCLILVMIIGLFKLYAFRRTKRYVL